MHLNKYVYAVAAASVASAQNMSLSTVLNTNTNLSTLAALLGSSPAVMAAFGSASNITILAPSNQALSALMNSTIGTMATSVPGYLQALLLVYHSLPLHCILKHTGNTTFSMAPSTLPRSLISLNSFILRLQTRHSLTLLVGKSSTAF